MRNGWDENEVRTSNLSGEVTSQTYTLIDMRVPREHVVVGNININVYFCEITPYVTSLMDGIDKMYEGLEKTIEIGKYKLRNTNILKILHNKVIELIEPLECDKMISRDRSYGIVQNTKHDEQERGSPRRKGEQKYHLLSKNSSSEQTFYDKYLKYKAKYLALKKSLH